MSLTVQGIEPTIYELERVGVRMPKRSLDAVRKYARLMVKRARENAPIKEGDLVLAINILGEGRDADGRKTVEWGVDASKLGDGYQEHGFRYDIAMEENEYNLGPRSRAKAAAGYDVGPGYMVRALWDYEQDLIDELQRLARRP